NPAVDRALASATEGSLETSGTIAVYRNLSSFQSIYGVRWAIILEQPTTDAYALAAHAARDTLWVGAISLAIALCLGAYLATRLTRPLRDLAARAATIASGDPFADSAPPSPVSAPGEIGVLARQLDAMAERIGEREKLQAQLAHGDRLATVGAMAARVAHEINNPLTTVLGYAKLLAEDKADDHPDRAALDLIAGEAERMKAIAGGLLGYARGDTAHTVVEPTDIVAVIEAAASLVAPVVREKRIALTVTGGGGLPLALCSADALKQVVVNLLNNAIEASPRGGAIELLTHGDDDAVHVTVADDGPGISDADRERVFEPFFTTKPEGQGTGLGLAVCRHLVSGFGGDLVCETADHGARFRVVIPVKG
ncbi:MAG TPA: HAMP domain-containing sensor histidine kinase, partial [Kofleriaceae bacterium]|nr:HAMP domain-containing sensor histidine kinase [Kofleriaceae bacterium]